VSLDDVTAEDLAGTVTTVVRALRSRETATRPAVWPAIDVEESVFLLKTEPELVAGVLLHQDGGIVTVVEGVGLAIAHPGLTEDEDVVAGAERVGVVGAWAEVDI
jgi:hypothetical protein